MRKVWRLYLGNDASEEAMRCASPLLGDLRGLARHAIFVAGQDPLRDEGIAYAEALEKEELDVVAKVYQGVPHVFGKMWELDSTRRFHDDIVEAVTRMLGKVAE